MIRTVQLLRHLSDAPLRRRVTAATNKVESFNRFSQWIGFGNRGVSADNDPIEQEKAVKFNALLTNSVIFHDAVDIAEIVRQLLEEGWEIDPEDLAHLYGGALHAFHHPTVGHPVVPGVGYDPQHAQRAWRDVVDLLAECLPVTEDLGV